MTMATQDANPQTGQAAPANPAPQAANPPAAPVTALRLATKNWMDGASGKAPTPAAPTELNSQAWQAVQNTNAETAAYAATQIAVAPNMMISQASGLVAQSAAAYFDGVTKLGLATQSVLLKQMTENIGKENLVAAAEDAMGALVTDLLVGAAAAVAAAAGAIDGDAAGFALGAIDQSIGKYQTLMKAKNG
jgi:hypothetical protein